MEFKIGQTVKIVKTLKVEIDNTILELYDDMFGNQYIVNEIDPFQDYITVHDFKYNYYVPKSIVEIVEQ